MKSEYVNPFVEATVETFETMCGTVPKRNGKLEIKSGVFKTDDLVGIVGLSGNVCGAVLMAMSVETGLKSVSSFLGEEISEPDSDLMDGFGEILNIIAGAAAAKLSSFKIKLALPTVLLGQDQLLSGKQISPWIIIPMMFPEWGSFKIEVSMEEKK